jgi:hypothetical protein
MERIAIQDFRTPESGVDSLIMPPVCDLVQRMIPRLNPEISGVLARGN